MAGAFPGRFVGHKNFTDGKFYAKKSHELSRRNVLNLKCSTWNILYIQFNVKLVFCRNHDEKITKKHVRKFCERRNPRRNLHAMRACEKRNFVAE